jgi:HAD superfamily hydrolase (TIGR01490 family)
VAGLALFDMDGTLIDADSDWLFLRYQHAHGRAGMSHLVQGGWWYVLHRLGRLDAERVAARALRRFAGVSARELAEEVAACYRALVEPRIAPAARAAVAHHRERGDRLAIVTAASALAAAPIARELGIDHVIATELAVVGGRLTGAIDPPLCYGAGKLARTRAFASRAGMSLGEATCYSDSISDLPLLEAVAHPVAVDPDRRLRRLASRRGWPIERWRR